MRTDRFFSFVDDFLYNLNDIFKQPVSSYCRLQTTMGDHTLVADDGSMISIMECHGNLNLAGDEELRTTVQRLLTGLNSRMKDAGHCIQVVMTYDPDQAHEEVKEKFQPSRTTLRNLNINIDPVMDDWESAIAQYCSAEHVLIVAWTRPFCLSKPEEKKAGRNMRKNHLSAPSGPLIQNVGKVMVELTEQHSGFLSILEEAFKHAAVFTDILNCHEALWWVRHEIDPAFTSRDWKACIPGDRLPMKLSDKSWAPDDITEFSYKPLAEQVFPREGEKKSRTTFRIGDHIHAPLSLELAPQTPLPFNMLFRRLVNKEMPFRTSFLLEGCPIPLMMSIKKQFANGLSFTSSVNKQYSLAVDQLQARLIKGITNVKFSANFDTWVIDDQTPECTKLLQKRRADLVSAIQAWGTCDCSEISGDPLLGVAATIPALMPTSPAPSTMPPLEDVLYMMPFTRTASIWQEGSLIFRTPDGKIMPYTQGSSKQSAWIDVGFGPMGTSKSVCLNTINWGFLTQPGLTSLPYLTILDIGGSSEGLIRLLQSVLPREQQHIAQSFSLRLDPDYSINPCDLPLGCQKPIDRHISFLVNLLCLFATPLGDTAPPNGIPGIARKAITAAYEEFSDEINPKLYTHGVDPMIDELVEGLNIPTDERTTWREISKFLFKQEMFREASLAQRYAVPLVPDIAALVKTERVASMYKDEKTPFGTPVPDYFWRSIIEAIQAYPILKYPTRFEIGDETKIVSIDLEEVAPKGGADANRQTSVMLMLARHAGASHFFMKPGDINYVPELYKPYHIKRLQDLERQPKRLCYDELHRYIVDDAIAKQLTDDLKTAARESRKWDLHIGLYSQKILDIPKTILELATSIFVLGAGTQIDVNYIVETFGLNESAWHAIRNLRQPRPQGATMFALFKVRDTNGYACQLLTNTLGKMALWAFSSTKEDRNVRNPLYKKLGTLKTLTLLAKRYPGGIKDIVQSRKNMITETSNLETAKDVTEEIINEILQLS